jgi:hypothetical protein
MAHATMARASFAHAILAHYGSIRHDAALT